MENIDDVRKNVGTVADFSNWNGIKAENNFKHMKLTSKERIIEPEIDEKEKTEDEFDSEMAEAAKETKNIEEAPNNKKDIKNIPAVNEAVINPTELKSIAVRLLPSVDKLESGEKYAEYCEKAIDMAFTFLKVWDLKVSVGE